MCCYRSRLVFNCCFVDTATNSRVPHLTLTTLRAPPPLNAVDYGWEADEANNSASPTKYGRRSTLCTWTDPEAGQIWLFQSDLVKGPTVVAWGINFLALCSVPVVVVVPTWMLFSESLYVINRPSVVCLSSETLVHPTQAIEIFGNVSTPFGILATHWHPGKILWRSSQGNPFVGGVKHKRGSRIQRFWTLYLGNSAR